MSPIGSSLTRRVTAQVGPPGLRAVLDHLEHVLGRLFADDERVRVVRTAARQRLDLFVGAVTTLAPNSRCSRRAPP